MRNTRQLNAGLAARGTLTVAAGMLLAWAGMAPLAAAQASAGAAAGQSAAHSIEHNISKGVAVELPVSWREFDPGESPAALAPYAPPFHLNGILALQNPSQDAIVQFAVSDNPLLGHDANWLDTQMHMASGSGMSVIDFLFYYFFPPPADCISEALSNNGPATFAPLPGSTSSSSPPLLQVSYTCHHAVTLQGFFASQVSSGVTFVQTNAGPRAYGITAEFYLAPMERVTSPGMTWYVFAAQRTSPVNQNASNHFKLPPHLQGAQADFYWAIGAVGSFPWVNDPNRPDEPLIHVAYAGVGSGGSKRAEFLELLQQVHARNATPGPGE
ncbi:MAG: hypothetical protein WA192_14575 [Candidatus Acidiferrales bacterium]